MSARPGETSIHGGLNRRNFIAISASSVALPAGAAPLTGQAQSSPPVEVRTPVPVHLKINGQPYDLAVDVRTTLLDLLRDHAQLTGSKKGCDHGQCGACTVHLDGKRVLSCLSFAVMNEGREVTTIEGLARPDGTLHPMQQAFMEHDGFQCGYCTPGQIMSAIACIHEGHAETDEDIREYMSGNICRCAAYPNIVDAIRQAKTVMEQS
ncbi:MAG TPA: 2Fe-2S iron-sulfur cluster-binding protein [Acetobacteraceae bacterium]|nr:2Fe-2S iron-sulfur cluster-binding protein [Acetobacteraceae bacterium]